VSLDLIVIAACEQDGSMGLGGKLPWRLRDDLAHFKDKTLMRPLIMGRGTFDSLPGILPLRPHIVLTTRPLKAQPNVHVVTSFGGALEVAQKLVKSGPVFVIGGEAVFDRALGYSHQLYLTRVDGHTPGCDRHFPVNHPVFTNSQWSTISRCPVPADARNERSFLIHHMQRNLSSKEKRAMGDTYPSLAHVIQ
jgi:dihydrofolate reductase